MGRHDLGILPDLRSFRNFQTDWKLHIQVGRNRAQQPDFSEAFKIQIDVTKYGSFSESRPLALRSLEFNPTYGVVR
jgi:hypothetical protein